MAVPDQKESASLVQTISASKKLGDKEIPELAFFLGVKGHSIAGQAVNEAFQQSVMVPPFDLFADTQVLPAITMFKDWTDGVFQSQKIDLAAFNSVPVCVGHI